jgi:hypothetical protein
MGDFTQKDMSGQLFENTKATKDTHPGYTGSMTVKGVKYSIAAWLKDGAKGKYFSISIKPWEDNAIRTPRQPPASKPATQEDDFEDSRIPF